ncbi:MAG: ABC transporter permease [Gammaproteobacteria bacterium]|nr:ABC transporter permease [Gammaproteobacteria bacterium]MBV9725358.1 ABC transporter permease [Gammaproteobacteria bacterium]
MIHRLLAVLHARNLEFLRDRSTLIFTLLLPVLLVIGMGFVFGGPERPLFKVGVVAPHIDPAAHPFLRERYVEFIPLPQAAQALEKVRHQQVDLLVDLTEPPRYWVNTDSPKGYIVEQLLLAAAPAAHREPVSGAALRYVDWLFPGILGMNMMFSCLFGVGYVVLRYRKSGFLKRLYATPLSAFEFLSAQVLSRLGLILFVTVILYAGIGAIIGFHNAGSTLLLLLLACVGALSMIALGLTIAARFSSEELVGGLLNLLTWPMMLLSGIWFSLEGSPRWVQWVAHVFPLTHVLDAARAVMLDGAGLAQIAPQLLFLGATALAFLAFGAWSFRWRID